MKGFCVWFTGLPGSGKTTLANATAEALRSRGLLPVVLDGGDVRTWLTPDLGFSREGRRENVLRVAKVARLIVDSGGVAIVALVSPYDKDREEALELIGNTLCVYVYGRQGELWKDTEYELPTHPHIALSMKMISLQVLVAEILVRLEQRRYIAPRHADAPSLLLGRFQTVHDGHKALVRKVLREGKNVIIGIRETKQSEQDPYTVDERKQQIRDAFPVEWSRNRVRAISVPDFSEIVVGRTPGYGIRQLHLDEKTESISGTEIRRKK